ncbi:unnamed protein product [Sphagnum compactum]
MVAFKKFVSSFRTAARLLPPRALIVERRVAHPRNNRFMTMERFYSELKYILSIGAALAGAAVVINQDLTKTKIEGVVMEVNRMGQQVDRMGQRVDRMGRRVDCMEKKMDEKFEQMEKKVDKLLSQQSVTNYWPCNRWHR